MALIEVSRLAMAGSADHSRGARMRLEDALHSEIPDDQRLVLVRRMHLAAPASSPRPGQRQMALRSAWQAATDGARHGSEDSAAMSNCVWFASESEAESTLLDLLLRGCTPVGWFWKLAAPGWRGRPVQVWLVQLVQTALLPGNEPALVRLIACCTAAGAADRFVTVLQVAVPQGQPAIEERAAGSVRRVDPAPAHISDLAQTVAQHVAQQLALPVRSALRAMLTQLGGKTAARAILRAQALRVSPALALHPLLLAEIAARAESALETAASSNPPPPNVRTTTMPAQRAGAARRPDNTTRSKQAEDNLPQQEDAKPPSPPAMDFIETPHLADVSATQREAQPAAIAIPHPLRSAHAGLWLVVPALSDLGVRAWLRNHPELLGEHPGALLIQALAQRHKCPADDPVLAGLPPRDPGEPFPDWTALWCRGLDRWLRRSVRRRVHDLARQPGKVQWSGDQLLLTYPLGAADIRLRLRALDRDPGWTDWLGLAIRYEFRDEAG